MNHSKSSLADSISGLLSAIPSYNPDEDADDTTAKLVDAPGGEDDHEEHRETQSAIRTKNISLLDEQDDKYAGKKSNRSDIYESDEDSEDEDDDLQPEYIDQESDSPEESEEENNSSADDDDADEHNEGTAEDKTQDFKHMNKSNLNEANRKSASVKQQIKLWENLLETRIALQKCLVASNKLPISDLFVEWKKEEEFKEKSALVTGKLKHILENMVTLQKLLVGKYPESKNVLKGGNKRKIEEIDDEEIPSDSDESLSAASADNSDTIHTAKKMRSMPLASIEKELGQIHNAYKNFRNATIQKWNDKVQIMHGKNTTQNSVLNQIEYNLTDKAKLIKRTQLRRSHYKILGATKSTDTDTDAEEQEYNAHIFDDDDFYHLLLRELIEVKSADITDPVQLSRQWIQLQNSRSKMKRKIDTRATKGRKIRYAVHSKLVNFMAPIVNESITPEMQAELFSSLFGKKM